jgi:hypothetical protein
MEAILTITKLKHPWQTFDLCLLIRYGKFKATPGIRDVAKIVTFAFVYGRPFL